MQINKQKNIKKRTWELKGGGKKQLKNRLGGKCHLQLVPFQRQLMGSCARTWSPPRQPSRSSGQLRPQPMLAASREVTEGSFHSDLSSPPVGCFCTPGPLNSAPLEWSRMAPCPKARAEPPVLVPARPGLIHSLSKEKHSTHQSQQDGGCETDN